MFHSSLIKLLGAAAIILALLIFIARTTQSHPTISATSPIVTPTPPVPAK